MAAGTAVIGSDVDGLRDLIEEGRTGRLVPAGDAEALAAAVTEVLTFRERATQMGQAGSEAMKRFDAADADEMLRAAVKTVV
jgi:glycosyltransferase involved in cell wall biosynthesis